MRAQQPSWSRQFFPRIAASAVVEAFHTQGPQQVFRLFPGLTRCIALWSLLAFFATDLPAQAAPLYWDGVNNNVWNLPGNWSASSSGVASDPLVSPGSLDSVQFNISTVHLAETVFLNGNQRAQSLIFANMGATTLSGGVSGVGVSNILSLGSGGLTLNAGAGAVTLTAVGTLSLSAAQTFTNNSGSTLTAGGSITGANALTLSGTGAGLGTLSGIIATGSGSLSVNSGNWILSGANTFTGGLTLSGGLLRAKTSAAALGIGSLTLGGGILQLANDNGLNFANNTSVTGNVTLVSDRNTLGAGTVQTLGTLTFGGNTVTVAAGGFVNSGTAAFTLGVVSLTSAGTFRLNNSYTTPAVSTLLTLGSLTGSGADVSFLGSGNAFISGNITTGTGALTKLGIGTLTIAGSANTNTGPITLGGGSLVVAAGGSWTTTMPAVTFSSSAYLNFIAASAGAVQYAGSLTFSSGAATLQSTYGSTGTAGLSFGSLTARSTGATGNFVVSGGANGTTNSISITGAAAGFQNQGLFFNGADYAFVNAAGTFLRAGNYGTDLNFGTSTGGGTLGTNNASVNVNLTTGSVTAQTTASINTLKISGSALNLTMSAGNTLTLASGGIIRSGSFASTLAGGTITTTTNTEYIFNTASATDLLAISSSLGASGVNALTKVGAGSLVLSGINAFTGPIFINGGTLSFAAPGASDPLTLGAPGARVINLNGGTFQITGGGFYNVAAATKTFNIGAAGGVLDVGAGTLTLSSAANMLTGIGDLTLGGATTSAGTLVLGNTNSTFSGDLFIKAGTLRLLNATGAGTGAIVITSGAALDVQTSSVTNALFLAGAGPGSVGALYSSANGASLSGPLTLTAPATINAANPISLSGIVSDNFGGYALTKTGTSTLTLSGANIYTGATTVSAGTLVLASASGAGTNTITVSSGAALDVQAVIMNALNLSGTGGALGGALVSSASGGTVAGNVVLSASSTINTANPITLLGVVSGAFALTKAGASTLTLAGVNTYLSGSTLAAGTLAFAYSGLGPAGAITLSGGSLQYLPGNTQDISSRLVISAGTTAVIDTNGNNVTFASGFGASGTGSLAKTGLGILVLGGSNTYTGNTAVSAGVLQATSVNALQGYLVSGSVSVAAGATLALNVGGALDWTSAQLDTLRSNATFSNNSVLGLDASNGNFTYASVITGGSGVTKQGVNSLTLNGNNTYTGPSTLLQGSLIVTSVSALGAASSALTLRSGTLGLATDTSVNAYNTTISGGVTVLSDVATAGSGINQTLGTLSLAGVTLALLKGGNVSSGTAGLTFGATTLTGQPTLNLGASTALTLGDITNGGFTPTVTGAGNFAGSGIISGTGGLLFDSGFTGAATLSAANTYTGATTVASGSLILDFSAGVPSNILSSSGSLFIGGATLRLFGNATSPNSQTLAGITLNPGATSVVLAPNANSLLFSLGGITRTVGSAVDFTLSGASSGSNGVATSTANVSGILGGYATVGGVDFATFDGTNILALSGQTTLPASGGSAAGNYQLAGGLSASGALSLNSLKLTNTGNSDVLALGSNALSFSAGGGLLYAGGQDNNFSITGTGLVGAGASNEFIVNAAGGTNLTIAAPLIGAGSGTFTKSGAGTVTLSSASVFTGATNVLSGTLATSASNVLSDSSAVVLYKGATLAPGGNDTIGSLTGAGNVALGGYRLSVGGDNSTPAAFSGLISGTGNLGKVGSGDLVLSGNNSFTGDVVVNSGVFVLSGSGALAASPNMVAVNSANAAGFSGGMLVLEGGPTGMTLQRGLTLVGKGATSNPSGVALLSLGNNTITGPVLIGNAATTTTVASGYGNTTLTGPLSLGVGQVVTFLGNGNFILAGSISSFEQSTANLVKNSSSLGSTLWLQGANNSLYDSVVISGGFVRVSDGSALGKNGSFSTSFANVLFGGNATLEVRADPATVGSFSTKSILAPNNLIGTVFLDRAVGGSGLGQTVTFGSFSFGVVGYNQARTLALAGRDGYGITLGSLGAALSVTGGAGNFNFTNSTNGPVTLSGNIGIGDNAFARNFTFAGNGDSVWTGSLGSNSANSLDTFTKSGQGLLAYNGSGSSFAGATTVSGGALQIGTFSALNTTYAQNGIIALNSGALSFAGSSGETTTKLVSLSGTTGNALVLANQAGSGSLTLSNGIITTATGSKVLVLGGTNTAANQISGLISVGTAGTSAISVFKTDPGLWVYAPTNLVLASTSNAATSGAFSSGTIFMSSTAGIVVGGTVSGVGIPAGAVVTSVSAGSILLSGTLTSALTSGTLLSFGSLSGFGGNLTLAAGTMRLQAISGTSDILASTTGILFQTDALAPGFGRQSAGGRLEYAAFSSSLEAAGSLTVSAGAGVIALTNGGTFQLAGLAAARSAGATADFQPGSGTILFAGTTGLLTNGILGGWATYNGTSFAGTLAGGTLTSATTTPFVVTGTVATTNYELAGGSVSAAPLSVNSLKITDSGILTLGGTLTLTSGGLLFDNSTGPYTITNNGTTTNSLGAATELIVTTNGTTPTNALTLSALIGSGSASLTKAGNGLLVLSGTNTYTGNTTINQGTLRLSGGTATLGVPAAGAFAAIRQDGVLDLNGAGVNTLLYTGGGSLSLITLGVLQGAGLLNNGSASATAVSLGASGATASGVFSGVISNTGGGALTVVRNGASGTETLIGLNTYTGPTILSGGGTLSVNSLANGGVASSIGASSNAAANLVFNGGVLQYTGSNASFVQFTQTPSVSIDRLFTLAGSGTIDSSGNFGSNALATVTQNNAALVFNNAGALAFAGTGARTLTLTGNSTGDNEIKLAMGDLAAGSLLSVMKTGGGQWLLGGSNTYSGTTTVSAGILQAQDGTGLSPNSNLLLNGGTFQSNGTFSRPLGGGAGQVQFGVSGGGFAASGTKLTVNLGNGATLSLGEGYTPNSTLILNSTTAPGDVELLNPINLGLAARTIFVDDNPNTGLDFATVSGVISGGTSGLVSLSKTGAGNLILSGANTYTGATQVLAGAMIVRTLGAAGATSSNLGTNVGGGALLLGNTTTGASLYYVGSGETTTRPVAL